MNQPDASLPEEVFLTAVRAAIQAPSMLNSQPWRFRRAGAGLEVLADEERRLTVADPTGWGIRIACGAATTNAALALAVTGTPAQVRLRPDPARPEVMARLTPAGRRPATPRESALYAAIPHRHSNRHPFAEAPVPPQARSALRTAAGECGAWLELLVGRGPLALVAEIVRAADTALRRDPAYLAEVGTWTGGGPGSAEGIPAHAAGLAPESHDLLAMRDLGGQVRTGGRGYEADPLVAILGTAGDTVPDQLLAGVALQHVLLTATDAGLAVSMLSQPVEVPVAREQLRRGLGRYGVPQMILRIGYGYPSLPSPRRPPAQVITP
jgi:nitroreductase